MRDTDSQQSPEALVEEALTSARRIIRYGRKAKKALDSVRRRTPDASNAGEFFQAHSKLAKLVGKTGSHELEARLTVWLEATEAAIEEALYDGRQTVLRSLRKRAAAKEIPFRKLGDNPTTIGLGPFRVVLEPGKDAQVKLGLEPISEVEASADAIFEAMQQTKALWDERTPPAPELFERIHDAYRVTCARTSTSPGERVALVDLLAPLSFVECDEESLRDQGIDAASAYPRHLLARQLTELNRRRHLEYEGVRLELGAATGGSTSDKSGVLYVQTSAERGQYFLSVRFVRS